ncbi:sensor histidine kinase [Sediminicoccus sp. BL-A-41-H5]|uniref:sensor histidine kinase n=1 Tax=Sediminicoccus sp. BL-A-41-H5 TaxID=3421106 RepID=UPI003D67C7D9
MQTQASAQALPASATTEPAPPLPRLARYLPLAVLLVPFMMLVMAGLLEWRGLRASAEAELGRAAEAGAEYAERALESFTALAGRADDALRGLSDDEIRAREGELHQKLQRLVAEVLRSHAVFVLDGAGVPLLSSQAFPVPRAELPAAAAFTELAGGPPGEILVSRPFFGPFDTQLNFAISRPRSGVGQGTAPGVVVVTIRPDALADGFRRVAGPVADTLALVRPDGHVLTRSTGQQTVLPPVHPRSGYHRMVAEGASFAIYHALDLAGVEAGLAAARRLDGFAVYATSRRREAELRAQWRGAMAGHLMFGIPATIGLLALSLQVRTDQMRLGRVNARLAAAVEANLDRLTRAHRVGLVGTFEYDLRSGVNIRSREYLEIHGLPPEAMRETHADWARRLHPDDRSRAEAVLRDAVADDSGATAYAQSYRIILPDGAIRWIAARGEIERDAQGRAVMMRGAHVDITPLRRTEQALAESDARLRLAQEALGIGTWEWQPDGGGLSWSAVMMRLWGFGAEEGRPRLVAALRRIHKPDRRRVLQELAAALSSGLLRTEFRISRPGPEGEGETVWIVARARLLPAPGNGASRLLGVAYDATDRKQAEERAAMLAHEVEHRAKNALAVVMSLLRMTEAPSVPALREALEGRVGALARTMGLLGRQRWRGAALRQVAEEELAPFRGPTTAEILLEGPDIQIEMDRVQPLSMALHELATNAAKYGALSQPSGRLELRWSQQGGEVRITWRELATPHLPGPPEHAGFGTRLIDSIFQDQLGGRVTRRWEATGLVCDIIFPAHPASEAPRAR